MVLQRTLQILRTAIRLGQPLSRGSPRNPPINPQLSRVKVMDLAQGDRSIQAPFLQ